MVGLAPLDFGDAQRGCLIPDLIFGIAWLRPGGLLQRELFASGQGVILIRCSVPQTNARRASLLQKRQFEGLQQVTLQSTSRLGFSFRARRSAGARSSAMALVSSAPKRKICAE